MERELWPPLYRLLKEIAPLNVGEKEVPERPIGRLEYGGCLLGDGAYDASCLYDAAFARGYRLVAPRRKAKTPGCGKHYQSPHRLRGLAILPGDFGKALFRARTAIERSFGKATTFGAAWGRCRRGCEVGSGCGPGYGPSCSLTPSASATHKHLPPSLQDVVWPGLHASHDWAGADWVDVDKSGVAANFDSHSKPFNVTAAVSVSGDRLYAAFRTGDPDLLRNSGESATAPFLTGGALDLMIGADPGADPKREKPAAGDVRLVVTRVKGKTWAVLYRPVAPGVKEPVPFSSPWRTITIDKVEDVSNQVRLASSGGDYELSVPLETLGLKPAADQAIRGDIGVLRGDGFQTLRRSYWSNKATGLTSDVPSEAMLTPHLWGRWEFK